MTILTTNSQSFDPAPGLFSRGKAALMRAFTADARVAMRRDRIEALQAKSDADLARMGLTRDQIPYHVFRDLFYT